MTRKVALTLRIATFNVENLDSADRPGLDAMKSKLATSIAGQKIDNHTWRTASAWAEGTFISSMKRVSQAVQVRMLVDSIFDAKDDGALVVVVGDFNADSGEVPVTAIRGPVEETGNRLTRRAS